MNPLVYYRKWRPQTLAEVVGQEYVTQTLRNAVSRGQISHAYLFCGSRGTGKTSTGRILAKAVNCLNNKNGEPCNECSMCRAISEGKAMDIIEIDAASNNSVDDIRSLREKINFVPNIARYKVYIIDEVHMLSDSASNALLKTLEEPPSHAIFILATTESHKILPTILSRCQRFDFRRISQEASATRLDFICRQEGITIPPEALRIVTKSSSGSLRDAENILEQLVSYYGSSITVNQVQDMLGLSGDFRIKQLVKNIVARNIPDGLATINSLVNDGVDLKRFNRELVQCLRDVLMLKSGVSELIGLSKEDIDDLNILSKSASIMDIIKAIKLFGQADISPESYYSLPLELALIESSLSSDKGIPDSVPEIVRESTTTQEYQKEQEKAVLPEQEPSPTIEKQEKNINSRPVSTESNTTVEQLKANWKEILNNVPPDMKRTVGYALMKNSCFPLEINNNIVTLSFESKALKEKMESASNRKVAEQIISDYFGHPCNIQCIVKNQQGKQEKKQGYLVKAAMEMGAEIIHEENKK